MRWLTECSAHFLLRPGITQDVDEAERECNSAKREKYDSDDEIFSLQAVPSAALRLCNQIESLQIGVALWFAKVAQVVVERLFVCREESVAMGDMSVVRFLQRVAKARPLLDADVEHPS